MSLQVCVKEEAREREKDSEGERVCVCTEKLSVRECGCVDVCWGTLWAAVVVCMSVCKGESERERESLCVCRKRVYE